MIAITRKKACPWCRDTEFYRLQRLWWMRLISNSRLYECAKCRKRILCVSVPDSERSSRAHRRVSVRSGLIVRDATLAADLGPLLDIGLEGLSFASRGAAGLSQQPFTVEILDQGRRPVLRGMPARRVVHTTLVRQSGEGAPVWRCGVSFGDVSRTQRALLRWFLWSYGVRRIRERTPPEGG